MAYTSKKLILTSTVFLLAVSVLAIKYWHYIINPWTRDGQVHAQVIQVTPRVTGPIVELAVVDNQFVKAGQLLFQIDPSTFVASLKFARAELDKTQDEIEALKKQVEASLAVREQRIIEVKQASLEISEVKARLMQADAQFKRVKKLVPDQAMSQRELEVAQADYIVAQTRYDRAKINLLDAQVAAKQADADLAKDRANLGADGEMNPRLRSAQAKLREAELNLEFTQVRASVDGYVTNLVLRLGSQAVADRAAMALVDVNSFWVHGFFRENYIAPIRPGNKAVVTLMTYPGIPIIGEVESIAWGIAQHDGSVGEKLLPDISPTFEWIRLAQRVPVRIRLLDVPDTIKLRVGTTASVMVMTEAGENSNVDSVEAVPRALQ
ncbi:multidrug resistance efflux pump [Nitrosomonas sp. Nm84]|uniref:HlyD family secretion protein n=1 Tax=Nitrosomonas sp. Nm84 TaxID=200124 RepID=UPI000D76695D|nr:HlyD family secretion protein [Nitrosomonas sp. Nm84]PXW83887.1 multidrug resistance efflux pump [Nitrosomonas sp. Nm84]